MLRGIEKELFISKKGMPPKVKYQKHAFPPTNVHI